MRLDAVFGTIAFLAIVAYLAIEFIGLIHFINRVLAKLGIYEDESPSVEATVTRIYEGEAPYAATRNAAQDIKRNKGG